MKLEKCTVFETVKRFGLEKFDKHYFDESAKCRDLDIPLDTLKNLEVISIEISPFYDEAIFRIRVLTKAER